MIKQARKKVKVGSKADSPGEKKYVFKLFIAGISSNSSRAIVNINAIGEKYLKSRYELKVIDIYQQGSLAADEEIVAVPLLIRKFPLPERRLIGDLSNTEVVLKEFDIVINLTTIQ